MQTDIQPLDQIRIIGASENNLKHIDVAIPKGKLVALTGVSGSGKSSLAFDVIAVESMRQWQQSYPAYLRNKMPHYERPRVDAVENLTPIIVVGQKPLGSSGSSTVGTAADVAPLIRLLFSRIGQPSAGSSMAYSRHHPSGMCPACGGAGTLTKIIKDSFFDLDKTLREGGIRFSQFSAGWQSHLYLLNPFLDPDKKLRDFSQQEWETLCEGTKSPLKIETYYNQSGRSDQVEYEGVFPRFRRLYLQRDITKLRKSLRNEILSHIQQIPCRKCCGTGLHPKTLTSKINGYNIVDYGNMSAVELLTILPLIQDPRGQSLIGQITAILERMCQVGIGYLSLDRSTETLSGGEAQRLKLVRHLGSELSNITYLFDEPTAGLHPADIKQISALLLALRDKHNNVLVVEHNREILARAESRRELGPQAGGRGGKIVYEGDWNGLCRAHTMTAQSIQHKLCVNLHPLAWKEGYLIQDAHCHNLKHITVTIPKGVFTVITGVAGAGKSSLACCALREQYPDAIVIDQKPIGTSIRSTSATYLGIMGEIRRLFGEENGIGPEWFSFNSKGACPSCKGKGEIRYEMAFADPVIIRCETCGGHRYNPVVLQYTFRGKSIEDVLAMTAEQALNFFSEEKIQRPLQRLVEIGLGYLTIGQPTSTLSGGELQRLKLASELHKKGRLYILDEPAAGLHSHDIETLIILLRRLVANNNTVVVAEHRPELVAQADWIIDMGPGGGNDGGNILFCGTPDKIISCTSSQTGKSLKEWATDGYCEANAACGC